jgi:hypothetical protein
MFYVGDRVRFCCSLQLASTALDPAAARRLGAPLYQEEHFPRWVVAYGRASVPKTLRYFGRPHVEAGRHMRYEYPQVADLDVLAAETQRPELPWHELTARRGFDRETRSVYVYLRSEPLAIAESAGRGADLEGSSSQ